MHPGCSIKALSEKRVNKSVYADNLQAVRFAVSLSLHFTAKRPACKLRVTEALEVQMVPKDITIADYDLEKLRANPISKEELDAFTDEVSAHHSSLATANYYKYRWEPVLSGEKSLAGFNLSVLIVGWLWALYRKMYALALAIFLIEFFLALVVVTVSIFVFGLESDNNYFAIELCTLLLVRLYFAVVVNRKYLDKCMRVVQAARQLYENSDQRLEYIINAGGFNTWAMLLGLSVNLAISILSNVYL